MKYDIGDIIRLQSGLHVMIIGYQHDEQLDDAYYRISFLHNGSSTLYGIRFLHKTATLVQKGKR